MNAHGGLEKMTQEQKTFLKKKLLEEIDNYAYYSKKVTETTPTDDRLDMYTDKLDEAWQDIKLILDMLIGE